MTARNGDIPRTDWRATPPPSEPETTQLLTAEQVGQRWQVPKPHVYRLTREGKLPAVQLGKYRRFSLAAIRNFEQAGGTRSST